LNGRIERRDFLSGLVLCLSSRPTDAVAQASSRTFRIGDLHPARRDTVRGWEGELGKLGYVQGRNLVIERRDAGGQPERLAALASELVRARVDLIVATGETPSSRPRAPRPRFRSSWRTARPRLNEDT
jgi:putative tryptophan/tyrosine transport system substrate-binding protein